MAKENEKFPDFLYAAWDGEEDERFLSTVQDPSALSETDNIIIAGLYQLVGVVKITAPTTVTDVKVL